MMAKQSRYSHEGREHRQMRVDIDSGQVDFGRCAVDVSVNVEADQWRKVCHYEHTTWLKVQSEGKCESS